MPFGAVRVLGILEGRAIFEIGSVPRAQKKEEQLLTFAAGAIGDMVMSSFVRRVLLMILSASTHSLQSCWWNSAPSSVAF